MKIFPVAIVAFIAGAGAAAACPYAGSTYTGEDVNRGLQIEFTVNDDCSQMSFQSVGNAGFQPVDTPQSFPISARHKHWESDINGARMTLSPSGKWVEFFANGNNVRVTVFQ